MSALTVGVLGAGAWGTALAQAAARAGSSVTLRTRTPEHAAQINEERCNARRLPGLPLHDPVHATADLAEAAACDVVLVVTPAQTVRATLQEATAHLRPGAPLVLCSKGLERDTLLMMTDVAREAAPNATPAVLSGPNFAGEIAKGLPAAATLACADPAARGKAHYALAGDTFRLYGTDDMIGAEIGGAVKNVLAIGCGIVEGRGLGKNAHAALITRGFAEMTRLGLAMGARLDTLAGLCGLGDLVLTCSSTQSRNMSLGRALGAGQELADLMAGRDDVVEGVATAPALVALAAREGVEMPIARAVAAVLDGRMDVGGAIADLMARPPAMEGVGAA